nr:hypothetical protein [Tanacetum cinerariifolium]
MINVLTSMDATTVLSSGVAKVPTGSGSISTAGPPAAEVPTGSDVVPTAESETPKKKKIQEQLDIQMARQLEEEMEREAQRMNEQIARDTEIARIHAEKELQIMIDGLDRSNETESVKMLKTSEEVKATEEVPKEKVKEMMQLVPIEEVYVEALQVKHPIIDWKLEEEMEREAQRMNEQIARDTEIARIHAEKELQIMIDGLDRSNETVAKYLHEYHQFAT